MELDLRKQRILQAIVQDYVATAEPVGSQILVERYSLGVKSATIRNEMAEMSERGYLRQPHTSAGRIPSDRGYRFYVNRLMALPVIQEGEAARIQTAVASASSELDAVLRKTCLLLAEMTHLPAVATPPDADETELRQVFLSPAGADRALLVMLLSSGRSEHRFLLDTRITPTDALALANALNARFGGATLAVLRGESLDTAAPAELTPLAPVWARAVGELTGFARSLRDDTPMYVEGTKAVFGQPEFRDVERLSQFLSLLQERAAVLDMLGRALTSTGADPAASRATVRVVIGEELGLPDMAEYSVVSSHYFVGARERGTIGVFGPTRMDYARASAAVELMARMMSDLLTRLSSAP